MVLASEPSVYSDLFFSASLPQDHRCDRNAKGQMTEAVRVYVAVLETLLNQQGVHVRSTHHREACAAQVLQDCAI